MAAIIVISVLTGFDPNMRATPPDMPAIPLWFSILMSMLSVWAAFLVIVSILRWWMKRGSRWDGQGELFNLVAASWLIVDTLGAGLTALGLSYLLTLPLWLYSVWVGANALSGAIPKASLGYSIGGIVIGLVPATLAAAIVAVLGGFAIVWLGMVPAPLGVG